MRYKILLTGNHQRLIDDIFVHLNDVFESMTASFRFDDLICHAKYFEPDALVVCMNKEKYDNITHLVPLKVRMRNTPFVVIGDLEDCQTFQKLTGNLADVIIVKPISVSGIKERMIKQFKQMEMLAKEVENAMAESESEKERRGFPEGLKKTQEAPEARSRVRKHILAVDDDPIMLKLIKRCLENDYDVATAVGGEIAIKFLQNRTTDLILLDYDMPGINGVDVLNILRGDEKTMDIPVVFLTGVDDRSKIQAALSLKPQGYILKPIEGEKLREKVDLILEGKVK